jgi:hypothetical protein
MKYEVCNAQNIFLEKLQVNEKLSSFIVVEYNWRANYRSFVIKIEIKQNLKSARRSLKLNRPVRFHNFQSSWSVSTRKQPSVEFTRALSSTSTIGAISIRSIHSSFFCSAS